VVTPRSARPPYGGRRPFDPPGPATACRHCGGRVRELVLPAWGSALRVRLTATVCERCDR